MPSLFDSFQHFDELNLKPELLQGIAHYGLRNPARIHQVGLIPILKNRDALLQAPQGPPRMSCLSIGMLQRLDFTIQGLQGLIVVNNDEAGEEFYRILGALGKFMNVKLHLCKDDDDVSLTPLKNDPPHILIGTVKPIFQIITQNLADNTYLRFFVTDDGERVVAEHVMEQALIDSYWNFLPAEIQIVNLLTTMTVDAIGMASRTMKLPMTISAGDQEQESEDDEDEVVLTSRRSA